MRVLLVLSSWLLLGSCGSLPGDPVSADLQEAALRWAMLHADTNLEDPAAYCIAMSTGLLAEGSDPSPGFLERFRQSEVPVRPLSACRFAGGGKNHVIDQATGSFGLLFTVSPVQWDGPRRGILSIGFLQGATWGAEWKCVVQRDTDAWVVGRCDRMLDV